MLNKAGRNETGSALFGSDMAFFRISDLPSTMQSGTAVFTAITAPATSAPIALGACSIEILPQFSNTVTSCDLMVYRVDPSGNTLVSMFLGVNAFSDSSLFVGGFEGVDLKGLPLVFTAQNFSGGGTLTLLVKHNG